MFNAPFIGPIEAGYYAAELYCNGTLRDYLDDFPCPEIPTLSPAPNLGNPQRCETPLGVGNPINAATGNKFHAETDYKGEGPFALQLVRYYNSQDDSTLSEALGPHWRHNYQRRIHVLDSLNVIVMRPDGARHRWTDSAGWPSLTERRASLTRTASGWEYVNAQDRIETYDAAGALQSITRRDGMKQTLSYDAAGRLSQVADDFGRVLQFDYTDATSLRLSGFHDPSGKAYTLSYGAAGQLTGIRYPGAPRERVYHYEDAGFPTYLTGISDERGKRITSWAYDTQGRARLSTRGNAASQIERYELTYVDAISTQVLDTLGSTQTYRFHSQDGRILLDGIDGPTCNHCGNKAQAYLHDANGHLAQRTDHLGRQTRYEHDARGRQTCRLEGYGSDALRRIQTRYLGETRLPTSTEIAVPSAGANTSPAQCSDASSQWVIVKTTQLQYTSGSAQLLATRTETDPQTAEQRTTTYTYYPSGLLRSMDGPRTDVNDITWYEYDGVSRASADPVHPRGLLTKVVDPLGHVTRYGGHDAEGRPGVVIDPNGRRTILKYTARGWLRLRRDDGQATTYGYTPSGQLTTIRSPDGGQLRLYYDTVGRLYAITDVLDGATPSGDTIRYTLDALGNRTQEKRLDIGNTLRHRVRREYDTLNRLSLQIGGAGQLTRHGYDANGMPTAQTDPRRTGPGIAKARGQDPLALDNTTLSDYDALDRLVTLTQRLKHTDPGQDVVTAYRYDALDRRVAVTDPRGLITRYDYNALGDLQTLTSPDTQISSYTYDTAGNRLTEVDAQGHTATYHYDALDRPTWIEFTNSAFDVHLDYDEATRANGIGRLTGLTDRGGHTAFDYDARGNLTGQTTTRGALTQTVGYRYDGANRLSGLDYPSGRSVNFVRDPVSGKLARIDLTSAGTTLTLADNLHYLPFGPLDAFVLGNGIPVSHGFDLSYRPARSQHGTLLDRQLGYDRADNLKTLSDLTDATRDEAFGYDDLDRLASASGPYGQLGYQYDANGNRRQLDDNGALADYDYPTGNNRLRAISGAQTRAFSYNRAGDLIASDVLTLVHGPHGRLITVKRNAQVLARYVYNGLGQRVKKIAGGTTIHFQYDQDGNLLGEYGPQGQVLREYVHLDGQVLAILTGDAVYYAHTDHLGSVIRVTDASQAVVWDAERQPFGERQVRVGTLEVPLGFPGQYYDSETGLHYNYARYYDPATGRYLTSDPIGLQGGLNTYIYGLANPVRYVDPLGLDAEGGATAIGLGIGLALIDGPLPFGDLAAAALISGGALSLSGDTPKQCEDDNEEECLEEIQGCIKTCMLARDNKHRMGAIWGGSWWVCMTGCVSGECQDYIDQTKHGEP